MGDVSGIYDLVNAPEQLRRIWEEVASKLIEYSKMRDVVLSSILSTSIRL